MAFNTNSRVNVMGLSKIIDHTDVASEIDIIALEKSIFSGKTQQTRESAAKKFEEDMQRINTLVTTQHGSLDPASPSRTAYGYGPVVNSPPRAPAYNPYASSANPYAPAPAETSTPAPARALVSPPRLAPAYNPYAPAPAPAPTPVAYQQQQQPSYVSQGQTQEERTKQTLRSLIGTGPTTPDRMVLDPLIEDEDKAILVDDISSLKQMLKDSGIDVSSIDEPRMDMSKDTLLRIRHRLQIKNDRSRASTIADELILLGAKGLEWLMDGKKEYFGYKLDATGFSNTLRTKLRRMKYETSVFIGEVMRDYSMSPKMRMAIEIVPSFILYVASRKKDAKPSASEQDWENATMAI